MMTITTAADIAAEQGVDCIWDLPLLEARGYHSRMALADGENSVWVCDYCESLHDPDDDDGVCECQADDDEDEDEDA